MVDDQKSKCVQCNHVLNPDDMRHGTYSLKAHISTCPKRSFGNNNQNEIHFSECIST